MKDWEGEFIEHRPEYYMQWTEKKSFEVRWVGKNIILCIVSWKYRQSFLLLTCCHISSGIDGHKRKESNKDRSCVVTDQ